MKILVFSDSHGVAEPMAEIARAETPAMALHLGDCVSDADSLARVTPLECVRGNCDRFCDEPDYRLLEIGGHRIFMTHGHRYGVKFSLEKLLLTASLSGADIVLFGHTHRPLCEEADGLRVINPGSFGYGGSYAVLTLDGGVDCEVRYRER